MEMTKLISFILLGIVFIFHTFIWIGALHESKYMGYKKGYMDCKLGKADKTRLQLENEKEDIKKFILQLSK